MGRSADSAALDTTRPGGPAVSDPMPALMARLSVEGRSVEITLVRFKSGPKWSVVLWDEGGHTNEFLGGSVPDALSAAMTAETARVGRFPTPAPEA